MKTAKETCEQIKLDKIENRNNEFNHIINAVRKNYGKTTFYKNNIWTRWEYNNALEFKQDLIKLGYKVEEFDDASKIERILGFGYTNLAVTVSACCNEENHDEI